MRHTTYSNSSRRVLIGGGPIIHTMGDTGVPSQPPQQSPPRFRPGQAPGSGLVLIVVVLVVILLIMAVWTRSWDFNINDEDELPVEEMEDGRLVIEGDVTWDGLTGMIDEPVVVRRSGSLTIKDCDIQVSLERLVLQERTFQWFEGLPGSEIVVEDSSITIVADPDLDSIRYFETSFHSDSKGESTLAMIWRAVDLRGAQRPVLSFDLNTLGRYGDLMVTVQPTPDGEMQLLEVINFEQGNEGGWTTYDLELTNLTGNIIGLSLSMVDPNMSRSLIRGVRVTDDGADLPGDVFPTGDPFEDQWQCIGLRRLINEIIRNDYSYLFSTEGDIRFTGSNITAPNVPHYIGSPPGKVAKTYLVSDGSGFNIEAVSTGGNVHALDGRIFIEDSKLDNVTVQATRSQVDIVRTEIVADREQMTLFGCWGSMEDCMFRSAYGQFSDDLHGWYGGSPKLWSVSIWGYADNMWGPSTFDPFEITRCHFRDSQMGLDLARTRVRLRDSIFTNISWIAIWDHESEDLGTWEVLISRNEFVDCHSYKYFQTHDCKIVFHHDDRTPEDGSKSISYSSYVIDQDGPDLPSGEILKVNEADADLYMPTAFVNDTGVLFRPGWVELYLRASWTGPAVERIPTYESWVLVNFTGRDYYGYYEVEKKVSWPSFWPGQIESEDVGRVRVPLKVDSAWSNSRYITAPLREVDMEVRLNGNLIATIDVEKEGELVYGSDYWVNVTLDVPMGYNLFNFSLTAVNNQTGERTYLMGYNYSITRADSTTPQLSINSVFEELYSALVLDPGTEVTLDAEDVTQDDPLSYWWWWLILSEGSVLTVGDIPPERGDGAFLTAMGPGGLVVDGLEVDYLTVDTDGGWAHVSNVTSQRINVEATESDVVLENCSGTVTDWSAINSSLRIVDCHIDLSWDRWYDFEGSNQLTFVRCDISGNTKELKLDVGFSQIRFIDTTFEGLNLTFGTAESNDGLLEIRGCDLGRGGGLLTISGSTYMSPGSRKYENHSQVHVVGNTFRGSAAGISAERWLFGDSIADNILEDGAFYRVWFNNTLKIVTLSEAISADWYGLSIDPRTTNLVGHRQYGYYGENRTTLVGMDTWQDPLSSEPPVLRVRVVSGSVVWFAEVDMGDPAPPITVPYWGNPFHRLIDMLTGDTGNNYWEE